MKSFFCENLEIWFDRKAGGGNVASFIPSRASQACALGGF